ncbi:Rrf2 family transcriptional regulator [Pararhodobacter aggregans]
MNHDSRLSSVLHALLHMAEHAGPMTSETLAECMRTNPVVVRRTMGLLRDKGIVASARGKAGGWTIAADLAQISLRDLYDALGEPAIFAIGHRSDNPDCLVEQAVNAALGDAFAQAEAQLMTRFGAVSLADLAEDFARRHRQVRQHRD